jgi:hypothetical protein
MILWILLLLAQETHHGMPTPVMEPPQSAPRVMRPDVREYRLAAVMAVPDAEERKLELAEENSCDGGVLVCVGNINTIGAEEKP